MRVIRQYVSRRRPLRMSPLRVSWVLLALSLTLAMTSVSRGAAQADGTGGGTAGIRLYVLDGGTLESDPARYRLRREDVAATQLSIGAYLIVHPRGVLMWDTGAMTDSDWTPTGAAVQQRVVLPDGQERRVTVRNSITAQLALSGYRPADVTHLALSHYHWDHAANANLFATANWLVQRAERDAMFVDKPAGTARPATYSSLKTGRTTILETDEHDVFGDGTVIVKRAAGHTPGHQVLYVKLPRTGGVLLSGDLYHYPEERTLDRFPTFEFSEEQTRAARRAVDTFLTRHGAQLWIQHDFVADARLRKAPAYYD